MDVETVGLSIRLFLRNLMGSRLSAHLEEELMRLRSDYETRLLERERTIADLREQLALLSAKVDRYELVLLPLSSPVGSLLTPRPAPRETLRSSADTPTPTRWEEIQAQHYAEEARLAAEEKLHGNDQGRQA